MVLAPTRLVPRKGVDRLIEAMPAIRARHKEALLLVAGDGPQRAELEAMAMTHGGGDAVRFLGAIEAAEMPALYAIADLVALPNRAVPGDSDGLPMVVLEAMACGRPVVGGRAGGTPEAILDGQNGLLVDGHDQRQITDAVCAVLGDASLASRLSLGALTTARGLGWAERTASFLALCRGAA